MPLNRGSGKRRTDKVSITMGMVWDLVEALLLRECTVELSFVMGEDTSQAQASRSDPNRWRAVHTTPITFELQRLLIDSEHVWPDNGPSVWERFDVPTMTWQISDDPPPSADSDEARHKYRALAGNGARSLWKDMELDAHAVNWRWSLSDGWQSSETYLRRDATSGGAYRRGYITGFGRSDGA